MILTTRDDFDKNEGTNLPMFSRSGKSTVNKFLEFTKNTR